MKKKRKQYTQEFKEEAVKLINEQGYQATEAARNLGINISVLRRWKNEIEGAESCGTDAALKSLRKEVKRLKMEREILKKATAFFANEMN